MAATDNHKLLLNLSLEIMSARDPLAAVVAFGRYFQSRFKPARSELIDYNDKMQIPSGTIFLRRGSLNYFVLEFTIPKVFVLEDCQEDVPGEEEISNISKIAKLFRQNHDHIIELKGQTYTDDITGLYNTRYLEIVLDREFSLAKRNKTPFTVLFLDLDHFKKINDSHGHLVGSRILNEVGQEIKKTLRESDITFRYGGDEFVMVLTQTQLKDALMVAERIRAKIEKKRFLARENMDIRLTASIGVAAYPEHAVSKEQILKAADQALYGSKRETRNRVMPAILGGGGGG